MSKDLYLNKLRGIRKELRKNATLSEKVLWTYLRKNQLGHKFRRQVSIGYYVVDFYCIDLSLAIEIDGDVHLKKTVRERDRFRQKIMEMDGVQFLRFSNTEIMKDISTVLHTIKTTCELLRFPLGKLPPKVTEGVYEADPRKRARDLFQLYGSFQSKPLPDKKNLRKLFHKKAR